MKNIIQKSIKVVLTIMMVIGSTVLVFAYETPIGGRVGGISQTNL